MRIFRAWLIFIPLAAVSASLPAQQAGPQPLCTIDTSPLLPSGVNNYPSGRLAFLTDHTLAVGLCAYSGCTLEVFDLTDGRSRRIAQMAGTEDYRAIIPARDGGVLLTQAVRGNARRTLHLNQDLQAPVWIPNPPGFSETGEKLPQGSGSLLTHSDNAAAFLDQGTIRIQSIDGNILGSFSVGSRKRTPLVQVHFLGPDRLLYQAGGRPEVRNFNGTILRTLKGSSYTVENRIGQSADGTRLMSDSFTLHGVRSKLKEYALVVPSMLEVADGFAPNGEMVRVIDTNTGKRCFEWNGKDKLMPAFDPHAKIDPSGRLVAIMTQGAVAIYRLPETCSAR